MTKDELKTTQHEVQTGKYELSQAHEGNADTGAPLTARMEAARVQAEGTLASALANADERLKAQVAAVTRSAEEKLAAELAAAGEAANIRVGSEVAAANQVADDKIQTLRTQLVSSD